MMLEPLAAANSTLTDDDKEYGCALVNIGAEVTSLMIFGRGAVQHTMVFPFGGMHFTKDIAHRFARFDSRSDENQTFLRLRRRIFDGRRQNARSVIEVTPVGRQETRQLSKEILCDIMQPRAVELLQHVAHEVFNVRGQISSGVVLTGGGSLSRGMVEIAEQVFDAPTRLGFLEAKDFGGLLDEVQNPEWAVAGGLALASMRTQIQTAFDRRKFTDAESCRVV